MPVSSRSSATRKSDVTTHTTYDSVNLDSDHEQDTLIPPVTNEAVNSDSDGDDAGMPRKTVQWTTKHVLTVVLGAGVGSLLEFYSFGLVAYFEPQLKAAFFPPIGDNYDSMLDEFTLYGIAFATRPFGGLIFGYIGDRYGRVNALRISLLAMVVPTMLFGLLPTYASIGITATVLIFILRLVQGLCVGGEMSTALVYVVEEAPPHMKATLLGYLFAASCGSYFSLIVYAAYNASTDVLSADFTSWSWRFAFISTLFVGVFGVYIRRFLPNSYEFAAVQNEHAVLDNPVRTVFSSFMAEFFLLFCGYLAPPIVYYSFSVWMPAYLTSSLGSDQDVYAYDTQLIATACGITLTAVSGVVCDRYFGIHRFVRIFMPVTIVNSFICYSVISVTDSIALVSVCQFLLPLNNFGIMGCIFWSATFVPDARIRNTLTGITYNLGMAIFVSTLFDVETFLANQSERFGAMYAGLYVVLMCCITFTAIIYAQTYHSWNLKSYHYYSGVNPHLNETEHEDISDEDIDANNVYSVM